MLREGHGVVEIRLRHFQTSEPIWMSYYLFHVRDKDGAVVGWATVSRDITERRHGEAALRKSEERLGLFENRTGMACGTGICGMIKIWYATPTIADAPEQIPASGSILYGVNDKRTTAGFDPKILPCVMVACIRFESEFRFRACDGT